MRPTYRYAAIVVALATVACSGIYTYRPDVDAWGSLPEPGPAAQVKVVGPDLLGPTVELELAVALTGLGYEAFVSGEEDFVLPGGTSPLASGDSALHTRPVYRVIPRTLHAEPSTALICKVFASGEETRIRSLRAQSIDAQTGRLLAAIDINAGVNVVRTVALRQLLRWKIAELAGLDAGGEPRALGWRLGGP